MEQWSYLIALGTSGLLGQYLLTSALRYGSVSSVIVMDYSALIWATLLGYLLWDELPDGITLLGATIVVASGLYIVYRETIRAGRISRLSKRSISDSSIASSPP